MKKTRYEQIQDILVNGEKLSREERDKMIKFLKEQEPSVEEALEDQKMRDHQRTLIPEERIQQMWKTAR